MKLRGLPYSVVDHEIAAFFTPLPPVAILVALNQQGQPSGFGFVQFRSTEDATASLARSNQVLGSRYVEVFRCTRADMEQALRRPRAPPPSLLGSRLGPLAYWLAHPPA